MHDVKNDKEHKIKKLLVTGKNMYAIKVKRKQIIKFLALCEIPCLIYLHKLSANERVSAESKAGSKDFL